MHFVLPVPRYRCSKPGCEGSFAPCPFAAGCFPATPKVSWDVTLFSERHPARWFDLRLLQLADALIFNGRSQAVYGFASVVHRQHAANDCSASLGWEHFKRQLGEAIMVSASWRAAAVGGQGGGGRGRSKCHLQHNDICCKMTFVAWGVPRLKPPAITNWPAPLLPPPPPHLPFPAPGIRLLDVRPHGSGQSPHPVTAQPPSAAVCIPGTIPTRRRRHPRPRRNSSSPSCATHQRSVARHQGAGAACGRAPTVSGISDAPGSCHLRRSGALAAAHGCAAAAAWRSRQ